MDKLMVIDGNSILNRAFYGIRMLTNKSGLPTNAIYGFLNILQKNMESEKPDYICVTFDLKAKTFRHAEFSEYKAQRKGMPQELADQMPVMKDVLRAMNINIYEQEGYEADDLIGTISKRCQAQGVACVVLTGDKDDLQLASSTCVINLTSTKNGQTQTVKYDEQAVIEKYGVTPTQFIDVKALMGDPSDNIPGVAGIGEKTALALIAEHKSIEHIYQNIDNIDIKKGVKEKLVADKEIAFLSKRLSTILTDVEFGFDPAFCKVRPCDNDKLFELFKMLEFKSLIAKLNLTATLASTPQDGERAELVLNIVGKSEVVARCLSDKKLYYSLLKSGTSITGVAISANGIDISYVGGQIAKDVAELFEKAEIKKIGHNVRDDIVLLHQNGIAFDGAGFDTMIAAYILQPSDASYEIYRLAEDFLQIQVSQPQAQQSLFEGDTTSDDLAKQVAVIRLLQADMLKRLKKNEQESLYFDIELPLVEVLADMQITGFRVDQKSLTDFSKMLSSRIVQCEKDIHELTGEEFNIASPKQLGVVLFEKLKLPAVKKTKTGYSTDVEVLEKLASEHEVVPKILEYRQLSKLKSTYADGLIAVINKDTNKIHSSFNQTVAQTGRISSTDPNMQNIPTRTELGREIRKMFVCDSDEFVLLDADYSQIELRVLAHIANDKNMIDAFQNNSDIHKITASQVFGVPLSMVTPHMRFSAKAVNFGIVYGIGAFSLANDLKITVKEATSYINNYLENYSGVRQYMKDIVESAAKSGYVATIFNRRRYISELTSGNRNVKAYGERIAMNTPIQGSAADIIKIAMVRVHSALRGMKSRLILQVHDELIVETHKSELEAVKQILKREMENAAQLLVPLEIEMHSGASWYDAK